jgi:hypothetical protein
MRFVRRVFALDAEGIFGGSGDGRGADIVRLARRKSGTVND